MFKKGTVSILMGLLLIAAALFLTAYNINESNKAGEASRTVLVQLQETIQTKHIIDFKEDYTSAPKTEMPTTKTGI